MGRTGDPEIAALCEMASSAARSRGHDMDGWEWMNEAEGVAATATCRRCGRTVHIRAGGGLKGAAGRALTEDCGRLNGA
jgi:hypothetical protein